MNNWMALPLELRLALSCIIGVVCGAGVNWAVGALGWTTRPLSPWLKAPEGASGRSMADRIPIWGWWRLRREAKQWGRLFWVRPLCIELGMGALFAWFYWWEVDQRALLPAMAFKVAPPGFRADPDLTLTLHLQLLTHFLLLTLMSAASWIDVEEKIIPDGVTLPGTLLGLAAVVIYPWVLLPGAAAYMPNGEVQVEFVAFDSTVAPANVANVPHDWKGLLAGLSCLWLWCFGLLPRPWRARRGVIRAFQLMCARIAREPFSLFVFGVGLVASLAVVVVWWFGEARWHAMLTSLVGLAAGGLIVWSVRAVGWYVLRKEAMGFGDVTLMAMIGAFLGWQASVVIFFLAPFAGLVLGALQWILRRDNEIPYGPFLCLAALVTICWWPPIWTRMAMLAALGWMLPAILLFCLILMAILLLMVRFIRELLFGGS